MTIGAREKNWIVQRDFVEVFSRRELRRFPESFDPAAPGDPVAALSLGDARFNLCEEIFEGACPFKIEAHLPLANPEDVAMRIGKARDDRFAAEIDDARFVAAKFSRVFV